MSRTRVTYGSPHEAERSANIDNRQRSGLLLPRLTTTAAHPSEQDRIDCISADGEDTHGEVPRANVHGSASEDETQNGNCFGNGNVPGSLVEVTGGGGPEDGEATGDEVGRASEDEGDGGVKAESVDDGGELRRISKQCLHIGMRRLTKFLKPLVPR